MLELNLKLFLILASNLHFCTTHHTPVPLLQLASRQSLNSQQNNLSASKFPSLSLASHFCAILHNEHLPCYTCSKLPAITVINQAGQGQAAVNMFYLVHWTVQKLSRMCALKCKSRCCVHSHRCWKRATRAVHSLRVCASALALAMAATDGVEIHHTCGSRAVTQIVTLSKNILETILQISIE